MEELKILVNLRYKAMVILAFSAGQSEELKKYRLSRIEEYTEKIKQLNTKDHEQNCRPRLIQA